MIGSLMSRMADAEKLSIPQLNQAVKNGTIPAYVGVPLIQEKMKAEQAAKAMVAQTQAQPPLARQVMEQADMMSGLEKLQSNLPEEGYAGGGIIAFAEGGVSLPDEDEDEEKNLMSRLMAGITSLKQGVSDRIPSSDAIKQSIVSKMPSGMRSAVYDGPQRGDYVAPPAERRARGGHKYENMVAAEAERIGLDPNIAVHALYKETGNLKNPESARSRAGAIGVMQLMPRTAKELGVDPLIPEENIRGGVMYLKQMYDKYQDPTLALAAYNAGPGRVDRALKSGQGIASLPRETQNYVIARNMAEGGSVKHFVKGDLVMGDFGEARRASLPSGSTVVDDFGNMVEKDGKKIKPPIKPSMYSRVLRKVPYLGAALTTAEGIQALVDSDTGTASEDLDPIAAMQGTQGGYARPERKKDVYAELKESTRAESAPQKPQFNFPPQGGIGPTDLELGRNAPAPAAPEAYKEPAADQGISDIKNLLKQRMEESGKQKRIDAYMSLLQAGLGMMGGSSPFASVNIGQGAAQGVAAQMAARKSQVADENAILTGQLGLSRAELYEKMRRDALKQQAEKDLAAQKLGRERLGVQQQAQNIRMGDLRRKASEDWDNSPRKAQLEADLTKQKKNWRQDTKLLGQYEAMRNRFINEFVNVGQANDVLSANTLLQPQQ
jgi:hypothetical protein